MKVFEPRRSNGQENVTGSCAQSVDATRTIPPPTLASRCVSGDPSAWRELHRTYYPVAAAFLRKLGVQDEAMEDACQEVFLQMFRYLPGFRGEADIKTWLYRLCATEAGSVRRRSRILTTVRALLFRSRDAVPATGQEFDAGLARQRVEAGLAALSPPERAVFAMFEMEDLSGEEIARITDCPVATVWRRLHYARRKFQERVEAGGRSCQ